MKPTTAATWVLVLYVMAERFVRLVMPKMTAFS